MKKSELIKAFESDGAFWRGSPFFRDWFIDANDVWETCPRAEWLLHIARAIGVNEQQVFECAIDGIDHCLKYFDKDFAESVRPNLIYHKTFLLDSDIGNAVFGMGYLGTLSKTLLWDAVTSLRHCYISSLGNAIMAASLSAHDASDEIGSNQDGIDQEMKWNLQFAKNAAARAQAFYECHKTVCEITRLKIQI